MPFIEIKQPTDFIRIKPDGAVTISHTLIKKYFEGNKVKIFHDEVNKKIGLRPATIGYKVSTGNRVYRIRCASLGRITTGEFYPEWSKEHKMLVFSYA